MATKERMNSIAYTVYELILNAIDANATCIAVRLCTESRFLQVVDNGNGIHARDMQFVGVKTKVNQLSKTEAPSSFGTRGTFLYELSTKCKSLEITSRAQRSEKTCTNTISTYREIHELKEDSKRPCPGTTVTVQDPFFTNLKYKKSLEKEILELRELKLLVQSLGLLHPYISFSVEDFTTGRFLYTRKRSSSTEEAFLQLFSPDVTPNLHQITSSDALFKLNGFISSKLAPTTEHQLVFINKRLIQRTRINRFIRDCLSKNPKFFSGSENDKNFAFLIEIYCPVSEFSADFSLQKTEIKFREEKLMAKFLYKAILRFFSHFFQKPVKNPGKSVIGQHDSLTSNKKISVDQVVEDWLSPKLRISDPPVNEKRLEIDLKIENQSPNLISIDFETLSGTLPFSPVPGSPRLEQNPGENALKRIPSNEDAFTPKKKLKINSENRVVVEDVNCSQIEDPAEKLWVPGEIYRISQQSDYFAKIKGKVEFNVKPESGTSEILEMVNSWENPLFQNPVPLLSAGTFNTQIQTPKSCTFGKHAFSSCEVLGQVDNKFIACFIPDVKGDTHLVLIDQHAAHERVRLELLIKHYCLLDSAGTVTSVKTSDVDPVFEVRTPNFDQLLEKRIPTLFRRCGIHMNVKGPGIAQILAVPSCLLARGASETKHGRSSGHAQLVEELIVEKYEELISSKGGSTRPMSAVVRNILNSIACHGAIKFGDKLTQQECVQLTEALSLCDNPFQCAHGRPILSVLVDTKQLETFGPSSVQPKPKLNNLVRRFQGNSS